MVLAKGIGNGMPVGATITRGEIAEAWTAKTISTFGGNPVSMAGVAATLEVLERENAPANAQQRGTEVWGGLLELKARHHWIGDVRGMGLMQAMELVEDRDTKEPSPTKAKQLLEAAKDEGLLIGIGGMNGHVIRIGPSLLITEDEVAEGLNKLHAVCDRVTRDSL